MKLSVALDLSTKIENLQLVKKLSTYPIWFKVGLRSYIRDGKGLLEEIKQINPDAKIFLDLKLYDIPNTMADAAESIADLGVDMFNIHASAGVAAMSEVMGRLNSRESRPLVLAVTALTSFDQDGFYSIYHTDIQTKAKQFAKDAHLAGLDGVVCSAYESILIKESTSKSFITLTPGIRLDGKDSGDQKRVATPDMAKDALVDFIVVGRPIYNSHSPSAVVEQILQSL